MSITGVSVVKVQDIAEAIQYGYTASATSSTTGPRMLRITDIQDGNVNWNSVPSCEISEKEMDKYLLATGDLVFARTGATTGKSFLIQDCPQSVFASYLIRIRPNKDINPKYLYVFFQSPDYWRQIEGGKRGIGQPNVNGSILSKITLPLPSLNTQQIIVAEIEKQFSRLDAGIAALKRAQANLKRYRASVLKAVCEGRLVRNEAELANQEGEVFESGEALLSRILEARRKSWNKSAKYKEPALPLVEKSVPNGWSQGSVDQIALLVTDGDHNPPRRHPTGVPHLTAKNVRHWKLDFTGSTFISNDDAERVFKRYRPEEGDLIITCVGTVGRTAVIPPETHFSPDRNLAAVRLVSDGMNMQYLNIVLSSPDFQTKMLSVSGSTAQPHLYLGDIRALTVPIPPLAEQERIVAEVERRLGVADAVEASIAQQLARSTRLRQSILAKMFQMDANVTTGGKK